MKIGERIKYRREELGMSQDELARKLGYKSRSSVNKIENDASGLPQTKIVAIANALSTTPAFIMGWEEKGEKKTPVIQLTEGEELLLELYRAIPDDKKQMAIEMLKVALQIK